MVMLTGCYSWGLDISVELIFQKRRCFKQFRLSMKGQCVTILLLLLEDLGREACVVHTYLRFCMCYAVWRSIFHNCSVLCAMLL